MITRIKVTIEGKSFSKFISFSATQPFDDHHELELELDADDVAETLGIASATSSLGLNSLIRQWIGAKISVTLSQGETDLAGILNPDVSQTLDALITEIEVEARDYVNGVVLVRAFSPTIVLDGIPSTLTYKPDLLLSEVVSANFDQLLMSGALKESKVMPSNDVKIPYITQYEENSFHFLKRLAARYGEWFFYDGNTLIFGKGGRKNKSTVVLEYGSNLNHMGLEARIISLDTASSCYDYVKDKNYSYNAKSDDISLQNYAQGVRDKAKTLFSQHPGKLLGQDHASQDSLEKAVKNYMSTRTGRLVVLKGNSLILGIYPGCVVEVKDDILINGVLQNTEHYGNFVVTKVSHYVDADGHYRSTFEAIPNDPDFLPEAYRISKVIAYPQPAVVTDTNDPDKLGRVKVRFSWQSDYQETPWIRVANLMSGKDQGVYFVPEVNEVVFVDFEFGNPDLPFVRGSMYHANAKPGGGLFTGSNVIKGIITKAGNHVIIDDSNGKEEIRIYNKDKKNEVRLSLDGETQISVKSEGAIRLEAKEIEMKAEKISMQADNEWKVEAQKGSIESRSTMQVEAKSNLDLSGKMGVKVEGTNVDIEGKAQTSVKGNAQLALEGGAQASLKGAMVMIN